MSSARGRRIPRGDRAAGERHGQRQPDGARVPGHERHGRHHQGVGDRRPEQPAHAAAVLAGGAAVAGHHRGHRNRDPEQCKGERDPHQREGYRLRQGEAGRVEVQRPEDRGDLLLGARLGDVRRDDEQQGRQQRRRDQAQHGGRSPAPARQAPVGVEQEQQRQPEQQPGAEPLHEPEGEGGTRKGSLAAEHDPLDGVAQPGLGQAVQRPQHRHAADHPGDGVAGRAPEQHCGGHGQQQPGQPDDPAR